MIKVNH